MRLVLLLATDYANVTKDGKLNVMGIFSEISSIIFPARHPAMHLVIKLLPEIGETEKTRNLTVKMINEDGKGIMEIAGPIEIPQMQNGRRPEINVILDIKDLVFPEPGTYEFVVLVDKDNKGNLPIYVNKHSPPTPPSKG